MDALTFVVAGAFAMATPLMLAALGELVTERSGVLNLSVEGMMAIAAAIAFMTTHDTGSFLLGFAAGGVSGLLLSVVFALLVLVFLANQVVAGLAVGILGLGLSALLARSYEGMTILPMGKITIPILSDLPLVGPILFRQDVMVYLAIGSAITLAWFLFKTKRGLVLRVVGENPQAAHSIGLRPIRVRFIAVLFGGLMAGLGGAYVSIVLTPLWSQGMIAGRGWIAVALVVFACWRPIRLTVGAYLFGVVLLLDLAIQALGLSIPSVILTCMPYALTIVVLTIVSSDASRIRLNAPVSLGENFRPAN
ncbi:MULTISPECIES: ABC transporter permease [Aminobacter]|uniref:ABC transporter permease n=1 Tax=Aminobacter TaxID=31988 RepID=UPI0012B13F4A|nr:MULTISPECIES: ABC transporter permease [Aminobacter]MRX37323.1 ABC transporter permease [Aminobacter sp. MDW-2]QNH37340.1 ABC transporter permease [Aminobacter sp. MDW-2]